jgi:hypothetical protein
MDYDIRLILKIDLRACIYTRLSRKCKSIVGISTSGKVLIRVGVTRRGSLKQIKKCYGRVGFYINGFLSKGTNQGILRLDKTRQRTRTARPLKVSGRRWRGLLIKARYK